MGFDGILFSSRLGNVVCGDNERMCGNLNEEEEREFYFFLKTIYRSLSFFFLVELWYESTPLYDELFIGYFSVNELIPCSGFYSWKNIL